MDQLANGCTDIQKPQGNGALPDALNVLCDADLSKYPNPQRMGMSPGLLRAREQYRVKNALTGTFITAFIVGVYWYSIMAVKQDDFTDVDEEARAMFADSRRPTNTTEGIASAARTSTPNVPAPIPSGNNIGSSGTQSASRLSEPRGVLSPWLERMHPGLVDPQRKTFVWGAPPVDAIGKISDRRP